MSCDVEFTGGAGGLDARSSAVGWVRFLYACCLCLVASAAVNLAVAAGFEELDWMGSVAARCEFLVVRGLGVTQLERVELLADSGGAVSSSMNRGRISIQF